MTRYFPFFLFIFFTLVLISSSVKTEKISSVCVITSKNLCSIEDLIERTSIFPGGKTRCVFDTNIQLGTNATYHFEVIPGNGDKKNNVLLQFQGGGGCFNKETCDFEQNKMIQSLTGYELFTTIATPSKLVGVLDVENEQNPYKDWTIVSVIYCTADIHSGNTVIKGDVDAYFNGANNVEAVLSWLYTNFPLPNQLVLSGYSAGALAAQLWSNRIVHDYKKMGYKGKFLVILDGYVGYLPESQRELMVLVNLCSTNFGLPDYLIERCENGELDWETTVTYILEQNQDVTYSYMSSKRDRIQLVFYCLLHYGKLSFDIQQMTECISTDDFYSGAVQLLASFRKASSKVFTYLVDGSYHCHNNNNRFYTIKAGEKSPSVVEWITKLIQNEEIDSYCETNHTISRDQECEILNSIHSKDENTVMKLIPAHC